MPGLNIFHCSRNQCGMKRSYNSISGRRSGNTIGLGATGVLGGGSGGQIQRVENTKVQKIVFQHSHVKQWKMPFAFSTKHRKFSFLYLLSDYRPHKIHHLVGKNMQCII